MNHQKGSFASAYELAGDRFVIRGFDRAPAFTSFLPGIAGRLGIPLWAYTVNRGQCISSLGVHHKGNAILEFQPANLAYERAPVNGFRTFLRLNGDCLEPFSPLQEAERTLEISFSSQTIRETGSLYSFEVTYFLLPEAPLGALVRRVTLTNRAEKTLQVELLDGLPRVLPFGLQLGQFKELSNLMRSWAEVSFVRDRAALYRMRSGTADEARVAEVTGANFYLAVMDGALQEVVFDPDVVFAFDQALLLPRNFMAGGLSSLPLNDQVAANKYACAFTPLKATLAPGGNLSFTSLTGHTPGESLLAALLPAFTSPGYFEERQQRAAQVLEEMLQDVQCRSGQPAFDLYIKQCYLDNLLRGGYPEILGEGEGRKAVHLYSRKHGDPERDYNFFTTAGEYYSQGNGNFRDVCQNRRNDVLFRPEVGDADVHTFLSLIQMDGYNPLEIRPVSFVLPGERMDEALRLMRSQVDAPEETLRSLMTRPFTPGSFCRALASRGLAVSGDLQELVSGLVGLCGQRIEAGFGEGCWSDHFTYCLDLVDAYLSVFPDRQEELLFGRQDYRFYDSGHYIRPRSQTQVLTARGVRQYGALARDEEKHASPGFRPGQTNWLKDREGREVSTCLFGKLLCLAVNKAALLDPAGCGIEMDGGRPGWCDAMNGLPGLFGSGMPETLELRRLLDFMIRVCPEAGSLKIPEELADFAVSLSEVQEDTPFRRWQAAADLREDFRERTRFALSGREEALPCARIREILCAFLAPVDAGITRALDLGEGLMPTYFTFAAEKYERQTKADGSPRLSPEGLPLVSVTGFQQEPLPPFLEGPARYLAAARPGEEDKLRRMAGLVRGSELFDRKLLMYRTSAPLDHLSLEYGRIRAFTPGWLERESVFLHMEYKYLYGLLRAGLAEEFFAAVRGALIPFLDPAVYGRSILENVSFIASSRNPDPALHGRGFVARLTGSTTEMLSIWLRLMAGPGPFCMEAGELVFRLSPILPDWLFDRDGCLSFTLLSRCRVRLVNRNRRPTFGKEAARVTRLRLTDLSGREIEVMGDSLRGELALAMREGRIAALEAVLL